jgi:hypothetical protein
MRNLFSTTVVGTFIGKGKFILVQVEELSFLVKKSDLLKAIGTISGRRLDDSAMTRLLRILADTRTQVEPADLAALLITYEMANQARRKSVRPVTSDFIEAIDSYGLKKGNTSNTNWQVVAGVGFAVLLLGARYLSSGRQNTSAPHLSGVRALAPSASETSLWSVPDLREVSTIWWPLVKHTFKPVAQELAKVCGVTLNFAAATALNFVVDFVRFPTLMIGGYITAWSLGGRSALKKAFAFHLGLCFTGALSDLGVIHIPGHDEVASITVNGVRALAPGDDTSETKGRLALLLASAPLICGSNAKKPDPLADYRHFEEISYHGPLGDTRTTPAYESTSELKAVHESSWIKVKPLRAINAREAQNTLGLTAIGPVHLRRIPTVPASTQKNLIIAATNRFLVDIERPNCKALLTEFYNRLPCDFPWSPTPFYEYAARFPRMTARDLIEIFENGSEHPLLSDYTLKNYIFTKREKICKMVDYDPRLINAVNNTVKTIVGPEIHGFFKALAAILWDYEIRPGTRVSYGTGRSANDLGWWFDNADATPGKHIIASGDDCSFIVTTPEWDTNIYGKTDGSRHDAHIQPEDLIVEAEYLARNRMSLETTSWLERENTRVCKNGRLGVKAGTTGRRASGTPTTSPCNTLATLARADRLLQGEKKEIGDIDLALLQREFGYKAKGTIEYDTINFDFLSGSFVPAMVDGQERTVWAPFPGRQLMKFGWTCAYHPRPDQMRSIALGYSHYMWVPILGPYIRRVLELTGEHTQARAENNWRPTVEGEVSATEATYEFYMIRYDLDQHDFISSAALANSMTELPYAVADDVVVRVADIDLA